jgi:predicted nuclease of predicted toxin-antitoxin system
MKFLIDNNLSVKLVTNLAVHFPGTTHVKDVLGIDAMDTELWSYSFENNFTILTKDNDFDEMSQLNGCPPKVIHLLCGNKPTPFIIEMLEKNIDGILQFGVDKETCLLKIW